MERKKHSPIEVTQPSIEPLVPVVQSFCKRGDYWAPLWMDYDSVVKEQSLFTGWPLAHTTQCRFVYLNDLPVQAAAAQTMKYCVESDKLQMARIATRPHFSSQYVPESELDTCYLQSLN